MTSRILFPTSHDRTCQAYYTPHVQPHLRGEFPRLVRYARFVALLPTVLIPLVASLHTRLGRCTGSSCRASTPLAVCHNARSRQHRVFTVDAARGKTAVGWCSGCTLHLVGNDQGDRLASGLTRGTVADRQPVPALEQRSTARWGTLCGDTGAIAQLLAAQLVSVYGVHLLTRRRTNMHNRLLALTDQLLLRKRALIETITDQLKHICQTLAYAPSQPGPLPRQPGWGPHRLLPLA
jgi:hypothetical protein